MKKLISPLIILILLACLFTSPAYAKTASWNGYSLNSWHDAASNSDIYRLNKYEPPDAMPITMIMHRLDQDKWLKLDFGSGKAYLSPSWMGETFPSLYAFNENAFYDPNNVYYYDTVNDRVVKGWQYLLSPDGKYGVIENIYYTNAAGDHSGIYHSCLIKDFSSGVITEWLHASETIIPRWLPSNKILYCKYDQSARQNVIFIYDPLSGATSKLLTASLYNYYPRQQILLFAYNEPTRTIHTYDLKTAKISTLTGEYPSDDAEENPPLPPADLDLNNLEALTPPLEELYQYRFISGDQSTSLPFCFEREAKLFVPVRPLMAKYGVSFDLHTLTLSRGAISLALTEGQYDIYMMRLFVTGDVLTKLGLGDYQVKPLN